ncbi:MAG: beta-galactosidase [bacterium]
MDFVIFTLLCISSIMIGLAKNAYSEITSAQVDLYKGIPTLFIDNIPNSAIAYMTYNPNFKYFKQFGDNGIHIYSFSSTPSESGYGLAPTTWIEPDKYDYSNLDERVNMILRADPSAYIFPRIYLHSPRWWDAKYPDELVTVDLGDGKPVPFYHHPGDKRAPSWASEIWKRDTADAIRKYISHIKSSPYSDRIIGYHIASGTTEEWMMWGSNEDQWADYSKPNLEAFRQWLKKKYNNVEDLRKAWNDPKITFESVVIPPKSERQNSGLLSFRDPEKEMRVIDFYLYTSDLVAKTIDYFAKVIKEETNRKAIVGVFYGYVLQLIGEQRQQNAGHLALQKVLNSPNIDFITSPTSYAFRELGSGYSHFMSLTDSVKIHKKMWFDENDIRTYLAEGPLRQWGKTATCEESIAMQRNEFANVICHACGMWWFDMGGGWYDDEKLLSEISKMKRIADESLKLDRTPASEIALIVDDASLAYMQVGNKISIPLILLQIPELGRIGAPFSYYSLDDIESMPEHKLYVFVNCFAPTQKQRESIDRVIKRNGHVAIWIYAPGFIKNSEIDVYAMKQLTGIDIDYKLEESPLKVSITKTNDIIDPINKGTIYGTDFKVGPIFFASENSGDILGRIAEHNLPGLVIKKYDNWTSIYSSAPNIPSRLLRDFAKFAGAHLYIDTQDVIYANKSLLALSVNNGGERIIRLPKNGDVYDLFDDKLVGIQLKEFEIYMEAKSTKLWRIEYNKP